MITTELHRKWHTLAMKLRAVAAAIFDHPANYDVAKGLKDPKVSGLALVARTIGNFDAMILLLERSHLVEARTLVRCFYENLFWLAALTKDGDAFIKKMEFDNAESQKIRGKFLLEWEKRQEKTAGIFRHA